MTRLAVPLATLLLAISACGCATPLAKGERDLQLGQIAESNLLLKAGDTVTWAWSASQTMHFDVHTHLGNSVQELVTRDGTSDDGSFKASQAGAYSLFWMNTGTAAGHLSFKVGGSAILDPAHP